MGTSRNPDFPPGKDLKSWPLGWAGASKETAHALRYYGFTDAAELRAYRSNLPDLSETIAARERVADRFACPLLNLSCEVAEGALRVFHFLVNGDAQIHPR